MVFISGENPQMHLVFLNWKKKSEIYATLKKGKIHANIYLSHQQFEQFQLCTKGGPKVMGIAS